MKPKTKFKTAGVILFVCAVAIVASAFLLQKHRGGSSVTASVTPTASLTAGALGSAQAAASTTAAAAGDPLTYRNTDYGFQVTFPSSMKGFAVEKEGTNNQDGVIAKYAVLLPTSDANYKNKLDSKAIAMEFVIFDPTFWSKPERSGVHSSEIAKNNKYVYTYSVWEESPADLKTITEKDFISAIGTFKLTN